MGDAWSVMNVSKWAIQELEENSPHFGWDVHDSFRMLVRQRGRTTQKVFLYPYAFMALRQQGPTFSLLHSFYIGLVFKM
jgi:hypothetical protein